MSHHPSAGCGGSSTAGAPEWIKGERRVSQESAGRVMEVRRVTGRRRVSRECAEGVTEGAQEVTEGGRCHEGVRVGTPDPRTVRRLYTYAVQATTGAPDRRAGPGEFALSPNMWG